ncbi:manganese efflux pump MntP family protein [Campylobacter mucosalis]|uniref:Putative manganese efflux pump MntP n=1 Tax=Campylobacter mucosalis CCUG 21559 TaxID=1032067 RepID=A0A6G5QIY4_9BACT|nr:manganese efflux pump MntP family protein [Campylobacter mucosalis]QCD45574.1 hypothetical membrane protein (DUF204 domain) [Campylobacter mucosalis CCUG 21559]
MLLLVLAFALAMDSVALSIINGAKNPNINFGRICKIAFIFGFFQAIMPFFGYVLGIGFVDVIASIDHFIAFAILSFLGIKMIRESREQSDDDLGRSTDKELIFGAVATSIDALAVGVTFSFDDTSIFYACILIGATCFALCIIACYVGKFIGRSLHDKALILGGVILILLGVKILVEHLMSHGF